MFQRLHQNSYPGRLVFSLLHRWGGVPEVGVVFQKVVPESSIGWCSKRWGGVPNSGPRILDGMSFQKLGWCSKRLSQNPHGSMGWCSKIWGGVPKSCPRIPTLYTTEKMKLS